MRKLIGITTLALSLGFVVVGCDAKDAKKDEKTDKKEEKKDEAKEGEAKEGEEKKADGGGW